MVMAQKQKYRQWKKIERPEINPDARIYNGAKTASSINGAGKTG